MFRLGQIWSVVSGNGGAVGFADRSAAVLAAHGMAARDRSHGMDAEVVIQDELGRLTSVSPIGLVKTGSRIQRSDEAPAEAIARVQG